MYYNFGAATEAINNFLLARPKEEYTAFKKYIANDIECAMEAVSGPGGKRINDRQSKFLVWQCKKIEEKAAKIDFGDIPDSKGDITKWSLYKKTLSKAIDMINQLYKTGKFDDTNLNRMNELHKFLITKRADFEYGYKTNNGFIMITYQVCCLSLLDVVAMCMVESAHNSAATVTTSIMMKSAKPTRDAKTLNKSVDEVLRIYKCGDWDKVMRYFKNNRVDMFKSSASATEAIALESAFVATIATIALVAAVSITGVIAIVSAIRGLISIYYTSAATIDSKARSMQQYLNEIAPYENNPDALAKQQAVNDKLDKIAGFIEARIIKDDISGEALVQKEDSNVTMGEIETSTQDEFGFDFGSY